MLKTLIIGGAGFIGTNLVRFLGRNTEEEIYVADACEEFFAPIKQLGFLNVRFIPFAFAGSADFDSLLAGKDIVYHLASSTIPGNSNIDIASELDRDVLTTVRMLDACVRQGVKKVIFISSGGAVYGKKGQCPIKEDMVTYPITSYGIQKVTIEKLLYLYRYQKGLDYRVIRLGNPYGPYQRPNGKLGVVTTFVYKALIGEPLDVYGDGSVVRDFIYIDDAMEGIKCITEGESEYRTFNLGSGKGTSVNEIVQKIKATINNQIPVRYHEIRAIDVPENYLDMGRYTAVFGELPYHTLEEGIRLTAEFLTKEYNIL